MADSFTSEINTANLRKIDTDGLLSSLREIAVRDNVPIARLSTAALLCTLTTLSCPRKILEAGTAIGYSSILMARSCPGAHIDTVEIDKDTAVTAMQNIEKSGNSSQIRVITGDAVEVFASLSGTYDMIFLDSAKGQYIHILEDMKRLLREGGLLVADNCIFYGKINTLPEEADHKHRTIIANMREFLTTVSQDKDFTSILSDMDDGVMIAVKNKR